MSVVTVAMGMDIDHVQAVEEMVIRLVPIVMEAVQKVLERIRRSVRTAQVVKLTVPVVQVVRKNVVAAVEAAVHIGMQEVGSGGCVPN